MLMEYVEGMTLRELIDYEFSRGIPFDRAWRYMGKLNAPNRVKLRFWSHNSIQDGKIRQERTLTLKERL
jgi:hypothetical protein